MKMQEACQALGTTDRTVKEIAHQLGVDDPYYFSRPFKQVMGIPPAVYRRHYREGKR